MKKILLYLIAALGFYCIILPPLGKSKIERELTEALTPYEEELTFWGGIVTVYPCDNIAATDNEVVENAIKFLKPYNETSRDLLKKYEEMIDFQKSNEFAIKQKDENVLMTQKWLIEDISKLSDEYNALNQKQFSKIRSIKRDIADDNKLLLSFTFYPHETNGKWKEDFLIDSYFKNVMKNFMMKNENFAKYEDRDCTDEIFEKIFDLD